MALSFQVPPCSLGKVKGLLSLSLAHSLPGQQATPAPGGPAATSVEERHNRIC